jgi:acetoin utilization deacetylase AcuC-like enzyme
MARCSALTSPICARHDSFGHPESNARLITACTGLPPHVPVMHPQSASLSDIGRVHNRHFLEWLKAQCAAVTRVWQIDSDTYVTPYSFEVARCAAGSAIDAVDHAITGEHCFSLMRPPGHHAEYDRAMGFCLLNNVAIAATHALDSVDRIAIVDWDIHHGNGTQNCFYRSDRVLYCSVHEKDMFPYSGAPEESGAGEGLGFTINAPLAAGSTIADYAQVFSGVFAPALARYKPDLLIVSAGQDILVDDQLGNMAIQPQDFFDLTRILMDAVDKPLALVLEGGYSPSHGEAIAHIFRALAGKDDSGNSDAGVPQKSTTEIIALARKIHRIT